MARPSVKERAAMFVAKARPSIAGQNGNAALYAVAAGLVIGFGLDDSDAWQLLLDYNVANCAPAWSENELRRTLRNARRAADRDPGAVGELARENKEGFTAPLAPVRSPANVKPGSSARPTPKGPAPPSGSPAPDKARTPRTPVFNVRSHGGGAGAATPRTVRTLLISPKPYEEKAKAPDIERSEKETSVVSPVLNKPETAQQPKARPQRVEPVGQVTTVWNDSGDVYRGERYMWNLHQRKNTDDKQ